MRHRPQLCSYYWREDQLVGNLGDALAPLLLKAMGYDLVSQVEARSTILNPGRCLFVIGSLLTEFVLARSRGPVDIWGCGWRGARLPPAMVASMRVYAVRGPHTVAGLGLPANTPLGDPALLLPRLAPRPIPVHGRTIVIPHFHRAKLMPIARRCRLTGCDELVSTLVLQAQGMRHPGWLKQLLSLSKAWAGLGLRVSTPWATIERIAGADFVLTGSLHGAILAQAYGVPWAAYGDGYIDAPSKWLDWAAYLGIQIEFVTTLAAGQQWWQAEGRRGAVRDLAPLLEAFPYPLPTIDCSAPIADDMALDSRKVPCLAGGS
ncbi:MAG: polysaccharide pyruvyl transferase family protein [Chloroflexi bacterium]|nr:polysaccharide pyruvyl transferase family protein [Chloroflexota bacterium]